MRRRTGGPEGGRVGRAAGGQTRQLTKPQDRESIELGSTDHIRIDKHTFEVSVSVACAPNPTIRTFYMLPRVRPLTTPCGVTSAASDAQEPREDYGFKAGINRQDSALTAPSDIELDYARRTAHADMFSDGATPPPRRQ